MDPHLMTPISEITTSLHNIEITPALLCKRRAYIAANRISLLLEEILLTRDGFSSTTLAQKHSQTAKKLANVKIFKIVMIPLAT